MLFVLGMEVLSVIVSKAVEAQIFQGLAGIKSLQRISVYAEDVVLFVRPVESELCTLREILDGFCFSAPPFLNFNPNPNTSRDEMAPYPFVIKL
jgi:hypothetical protein